MKMILIILVAAYALVCVAAFALQARMVYFPSRDDAGDPSRVGLDFRDVTFATATGRELHGWLIPAPAASAIGYTLLYCHGNAGNITHRLESIRQFVDLGLSVFIFDYGGYGRSSGRPSESGTYEDVAAAWDYLTETGGLAPDQIVLFGRSLGGAVAIDLATEVEPRALIVESCFTSVPELGSRLYPWLPVRLLARIRYDNAKKVPSIRVPKLFIHSLDDDIVPYGMGRRLYNRAARPKQFLRIRGTHNDGFFVSESKYEEGLKSFLASLDQPRIESEQTRDLQGET
jgi:fermentation-respiration switch protein FrsA (DUF1100 family)